MLIDILIPTYNRGTDVLANLNMLQQEIAKHKLGDQIQVIISDNCSPDNTATLVKEFQESQAEGFVVQYHCNKTNIGLEKNALAVLEKAKSPYVLFLGDDDFLAPDYLPYCLEKIRTVDNLGCIIPGILSVFQDQTTKDVRGNSGEKILNPGFEAVLEGSHWGHQMSGILCKREGLIEDYLEQEEYRNPYLFLYFTANRLYHYKGIINFTYKTSVNTFNEKDWGYNKVGLLDDVYKCYFYFIKTLSAEKVTELLLRFTVLHSYRLAFQSKNAKKVYQQYQYLTSITSHLKGAKVGLRKLFLKDYIKAIFK
jgi:abequosyltransferase